MGYGKGKTEGGHKRGHGAMALWVTHQEAKFEARKRRRLAARYLVRQAATENAGAGSTDQYRGCEPDKGAISGSRTFAD